MILITFIKSICFDLVRVFYTQTRKGGKCKNMAQGRPIANVINLGAWLVGIIVSLAVGFGMIDGTLRVPYLGSITMYAGWAVVVLTIASIVLAIADRF